MIYNADERTEYALGATWFSFMAPGQL